MAAAMAEVVGAMVPVTVGNPPAGTGVVDLGSRSGTPERAAAAAADVDTVRSRWTAHKIDSTLRGNWVAEVLARQAVLRRPVVLLPAWPAMGRTCRGGVVHVHGDAVAAVQSSAPWARSVAVPELANLADNSVVWVDIETDDELAAAASAVAELPVLVAGPAGAIGAVARARFGDGRARHDVPRVQGAVLVVCGSATEVSAQQLSALAAERPDVEVMRAPPPHGPLDGGAVVRLAERVRPRLQSLGALVLIGGDTAAAVLGPAPRLVGGYAAPGIPWSLAADGVGPVVFTKAGGFGARNALVHLLHHLQPPPE